MTEQEYTPTTEEVWVPDDSDVFHAASRYLSHDDLARWLAEHDRQVRAEALEQAADAVRAFGGLGSEASGHTSTYSVRNWLRARAQAIREARSER